MPRELMSSARLHAPCTWSSAPGAADGLHRHAADRPPAPSGLAVLPAAARHGAEGSASSTGGTGTLASAAAASVLLTSKPRWRPRKAHQRREDRSSARATASPVRAPEYDHSIPSHIAHRHPDYDADTEYGTSSVSKYDPSKHGEVTGDFADIRKTLDYSWHTNYTVERQAWQDEAVRLVVNGHQQAQEEPWVVFTCGAMGAGKGHAMGWLSRHNDFPLEDMAHIDPDHFKAMMPEWKGYKRSAQKEAGTMCHKESGFLQELAQEVALRQGQHLWIDGSLADHEWYSNVFVDIRKRFPQYSIAIVYVHCRSELVFERAEARGRKTGRFIPREVLEESIASTRESIMVLGPQVDFVASINNDNFIPEVELCEDHNIDSDTCTVYESGNVPDNAKMPPPFRAQGPPICPRNCNIGACVGECGLLGKFVDKVNSEFGKRWIQAHAVPPPSSRGRLFHHSSGFTGLSRAVGR